MPMLVSMFVLVRHTVRLYHVDLLFIRIFPPLFLFVYKRPFHDSPLFQIIL